MHHPLRIAIAVFFLVRASHVVLAQSAPDTTALPSFRAFPSQRIFPRMSASGTAHQLGMSKDFTSPLIRGSIGYQGPLVETTFGTTQLQLGAGATVLASIIKEPRLLQVVTVDFLVEFPVDIRLTDRITLRTGYGHFSAHFADDGIEILRMSSVNYAKDYILLLGCWRLPCADAVLYGGGQYDYHSIPVEDKHWVLQWGCEGGYFRVLPESYLYFAVDLKLKSEVAWASTQSYQCGLKLFPRNERNLRLAYTYRTGIDDRGQFFRERTDISQLGLYLDF